MNAAQKEKSSRYRKVRMDSKKEKRREKMKKTSGGRKGRKSEN